MRSEMEEKVRGVFNRLTINFPMAFSALVRFDIAEDEAHIDTMGVRIENNRIKIIFNPNFVKPLKNSELTFALIHEAFHILLHHCTIRSSDIKRHYKENIAQDLAINCLIEETNFVKAPLVRDENGNPTTEKAILLPSLFGFPEQLSYEHYLKLLDEKFPDTEFEISIIADDNGSPDSGQGDKENDKGKKGNTLQANGELGEITNKAKIQDNRGNYEDNPVVAATIAAIVEDMNRNHMWGNLPASVVGVILRAQATKIAWHKYLRKELGRFVHYEKTTTIRRWDKYFGKPFPGSTSKSITPIAVYFDTSGSVDNSDIGKFIFELEQVSKKTPVYQWCFDVDVKDPDKMNLFYKKRIPKLGIKGRGGTSFAPIIEHAKKKRINQIIILTDGYAEEITKEMCGNLNIIWVITKDGRTSDKHGKVIKID